MSDKKEKKLEIKKVSKDMYINVSKIKTENLDLDGDSEKVNDENVSSAEKKSGKDRNQGDETVGIP